MDVEALQDIGLSDGEVKVYLALIELGPSTAGPIMKRSRVSSSKIYDVLERLMQKGIVSYVTKEKTRVFQAEDPTKIIDLVSEQEERLQKKKKEIEKLVPQLRKEGGVKNEIQVYKGFKGVQTITEHIYTNLKKGDTWYNIGVPSFQEDKYHNYWYEDHLKRIKHGIRCRMLFNIGTPRETLLNRNSYKGCDARYMPIPVETPSWILIYRNVTVIILPGKEPMAIEITNKEIYGSFLQYFNAFWKLSKPFSQ